jgi:hypothetical protein
VEWHIAVLWGDRRTAAGAEQKVKNTFGNEPFILWNNFAVAILLAVIIDAVMNLVDCNPALSVDCMDICAFTK